MKSKKRYCVQKVERYDEANGVTYWGNTTTCHDNLEVLKLFCPKGLRIFDNKEGKIAYEPK